MMYNKILMTIVLILTSMGMARAVVVNGVQYTLLSDADQTVQVVQPKAGSTYSGAIVIPETITTGSGYTYRVVQVADGAFSNCTGLTSVTLPDGVKKIGSQVFSGCTELQSVSLPTSLTEMGSNAFANCGKLRRVTLNQQDGLAAWCSVKFANAVANPLSNGSLLYLGNSTVTTLTVPEGVTHISDYAFYGADIDYINFNKTKTLGKAAFRKSAVRQIKSWGQITDVSEEAFRDCKKLTSVSISRFSTVRSISKSAFSGCDALASVDLPTTVTSIGTSAFDSCLGLQSVTLPAIYDNIGAMAFAHCPRLVSVDMSLGVLAILNNEVFLNCSSLRYVTLPVSLEKIYGKAFGSCTNLHTLTIPRTVSFIAEKAFDGDFFSSFILLTPLPFNDSWGATLYDTELGEGLYVKDNVVMGYNGHSETVIIPYGVTGIARSAFAGHTNVRQVSLPSSLESIGEMAFQQCGLTSVNIPATVSQIGDYAFSQCNGLTSIEFPFGMQSVSKYVCKDCKSLARVFIPSSVTTVLSGAFQGCTSLSTVECKATTVPTTSSDAFSQCPTSAAMLTVPESSVSAYTAKSPWSSFQSVSRQHVCSLPQVTWQNGKLSITSQTPGATFDIQPQIQVQKDDASLNNHTLVSTDIKFVITTRKDGYTPSVPEYTSFTFTPGDLNDDGKLTVSDVSKLIDTLRKK